MSSTSTNPEFSTWKLEFDKDRDFYVILLILLILGLLFMLLLGNWKFPFDDSAVEQRRYAQIKLGGGSLGEADFRKGLGKMGGDGTGKGRITKGRQKATGKGSSQDRAMKQSLLGVISSRAKGGSALGRILQKGGLGSDVDRALGNVQKATGGGGKGSRYRGSGLGGTGELSEGAGVGTKGMGRVGTGYGGGGDNIDLGVKGTHKVYARLTRGKASIDGKLDPSLIERVVRDNLAGLKYCYEKELNLKPDLAGKIVVQFTIGLAGTVTEAVMESSALQDSKAEDCILRRIKRWRFPKPQGGDVIVAYPFVFSPNQ